MAATRRATSWNSPLPAPIGALTTSKARASGPSANLGRVAFAQARERDRFLGQRIADRRAQHVGALVVVQRLELLPALAVEQLDVLGRLAPALGRPQDVGAQPLRLRPLDLGDHFEREIVAADIGQRARLEQQPLLAQFVGKLGAARRLQGGDRALAACGSSDR